MYFCFQPEMKPLGKAEQQTCGAASGEFGLTIAWTRHSRSDPPKVQRTQLLLASVTVKKA
jgi:hypothetical protein